MALQTVLGQPSWRVASANVEAFVTQTGGMLGPVKFDIGGRNVEPLSIAPWSEEAGDFPPVIKALRGDFFCLPFGVSLDPYLGEEHPIHGETANGEWQFDNLSGPALDLVFESRIRPAKVYKTVRCGDNAVYQRHMVAGMKGPMCFGHHAMVKFNSPGRLSFSPTLWRQVLPGQFENAASGGYSSLHEGAEFNDMRNAPLAVGGTTDLTEYPAREGYEDLVQFASDPAEPFAWAAVTFQEEGYVYFQLKDPRVLTSTVLWFSNGGRHYAPWSGRHRAVLGIEEVTSYFHLGLRGSIMPNPLQSRGIATYRDLLPGEPLEVRTVFGVAETPTGFDRVSKIVQTGTGIVLLAESGVRVERPLDLMFLGVR